jgi:energy-coupling factor transporter ATP-binding protein EcfA2
MSCEELLEEAAAIAQLIDRGIDAGQEGAVLGAPFATLRAGPMSKLPRAVHISHALHFDCLQVAALAIAADGVTSAAEIEWVFPLAFRAAGYLARCRPSYAEHAGLSHDEVPAFFERYREDPELFGMACDKTRWLGLEVCARFAQLSKDDGLLDRYERVITGVMDEVTGLEGVTEAEAIERERLEDELTSLRQRLEASHREASGVDGRVEAFCAPQSPSVFSSVAQASHVWERDPLDVEVVHSEARDVFAHLIDAATDGRADSGKLLLIRGGAGSGKTHLMRAFRNYLHERQLGYAAYLQMTSKSEDYSKYALVNLIDSLDRPYDPPMVQTSALIMLSDSVVEPPDCLSPDQLRRLRENVSDEKDPVSPLVDQLLRNPQLSSFDPDLLRALVHLQRRDPPITARAVKYLRCQELNDYDRDLLGGIAARGGGDAPLRTIVELGQLAATTGNALVFLVDQLEDIVNLGEDKERFPRSVDVLRAITDGVPSAVVVISCLDDMYEQVRPFLTRSALDRLEREPTPITLTSRRSADEIEAMITRRLRVLYDDQGVRFRENEPLFPFQRADLDKLTNLRTRDVLNWCHEYRKRCVAAGELIDASEVAAGVSRDSRSSIDWSRRYNDARTGFAESRSEDDGKLLDLLADAARQCSAEIGASIELRQDRAGGVLFATLPTETPTTYAIGICNKRPQGRGLAKQIENLEKAAGSARPALVRCSPFPDNAKTQIATQLGEIVKRGGRRVVVEDSEWRAVMAFSQFAERHRNEPGFAEWVRAEQPLSHLASLRELFELDAIEHARRAAPAARPAARRAAPTAPEPVSKPAPRVATENKPEPKPKPKTAAAKKPDATVVTAADAMIELGRQIGLGGDPVRLELEKLRVHAGFLGTTGSGKTTVALNIIEQALERGVSVVVVDRKGDLCRYADPTWWREEPADAQAARRKKRLAGTIEVALYTPGDATGVPLALPVAASSLAEASSRERARGARQSADALGAMMGYGGGASHKHQLVILGNAIELLVESGGAVELEALVEIIANEDPSLVNKIGRLNTKHFNKLVDDLEGLKYRHGELLDPGAKPLEPGALFAPPRPRLSIISTKFLGGDARIEFWVSRFLVELARWASANPSERLQTLVFFDEADIYMPAQSKPATKEPMLDLLKRARSAGVGLLLGTQNPGDFDYRSRDNIRTWFVGRVAEKRAVGKMKALLGEYRTSIDTRLAKQKTGDFFLLHDGVTELHSSRSLMETRQLPEDQIRALATVPRRVG